MPGDDNNTADIDRLFSTAPDHGGNDSITTGDGDDIIIGGEDGEIVSDVIIGVASDVARTVAADATDGDTIDAGPGQQYCLSAIMARSRQRQTWMSQVMI